MAWIGTELWHHVRYTAPLVGTVLAAGCLGYARLFGWLSARRHSRALLTSVWLLAASGLLAADYRLGSWFALVPRPISATEARELWEWIDQIGPDEGVIAQFELTAPLSSRKLLICYGMVQQRPPHYPELAPEITWAFYRQADIAARAVFTNQRFLVVHDGPQYLVFRRGRQSSSPAASPPRRRLTHWRSQQAATRFDVLGNTYWVLGDVLRTVYFLAPGLALFLWTRRHPALTALVPDSRDPGARTVLRNALIFAAMFGTTGGALDHGRGDRHLVVGPAANGGAVDLGLDGRHAPRVALSRPQARPAGRWASGRLGNAKDWTNSSLTLRVGTVCGLLDLVRLTLTRSVSEAGKRTARKKPQLVFGVHPGK